MPGRAGARRGHRRHVHRRRALLQGARPAACAAVLVEPQGSIWGGGAAGPAQGRGHRQLLLAGRARPLAGGRGAHGLRRRRVRGGASELARREGLLVGGSAGAAAHAARDVARDAARPGASSSPSSPTASSATWARAFSRTCNRRQRQPQGTKDTESRWDSPPTASTPGQEPDPSTGAIITPIFQTSTYVQEGIGQHKGYEYARTQNPTRRALEKNLAALEGGTDAYCYASGMAATQAVLSLVKPGQRVVVSDNVYGGTHRLFTKVLAQLRDRVRVPRRQRRRARSTSAAGALRPALDRDAHQPADEGLRHRGAGRDRARGAARCWRWTTRS